MNKTITYGTFTVSGLFVTGTFLTAQTYTQLGIAVILYPLLVWFAYELFVKKDQHISISEGKSISRNISQTVSDENEDIDGVVVADVEKRAFLKMIGAAGISFFIFSLVNRKSNGLLFGGSQTPETTKLENTEGTKINPAEKQPLDGYQISEMDDSDVTYYGFTNKEGAWFVMKEDEIGSFRYSSGTSNFSSNWKNRKNLNYAYYYEAF